MNPSEFERWNFDALSQILHALAENAFFRTNLIFKGAIILSRYLPTSRKSLDIDSNLASDFVGITPGRVQQEKILKSNLEQAISRHFEIQIKSKVHPRGWAGFEITISIKDHENLGVRGLPNLYMDVAAPEVLSKDSLKKMPLGRSEIHVYSLERITGEKARAYLTTLPTYRKKIGGFEKSARVRDLYDLTKILQNKGISNTTFWEIAGREFELACESRFVDCMEPDCFFEEWSIIEGLYLNAPTIPKDISIGEIKKTILAISNFWAKKGIIPFSFPLAPVPSTVKDTKRGPTRPA
jgi:predicted nucleotidyltransferase component of viral defense system